MLNIINIIMKITTILYFEVEILLLGNSKSGKFDKIFLLDY